LHWALQQSAPLWQVSFVCRQNPPTWQVPFDAQYPEQHCVPAVQPSPVPPQAAIFWHEPVTPASVPASAPVHRPLQHCTLLVQPWPTRVHIGTPQAMPVAVCRQVPLQQSLGSEHAPWLTHPVPVSPKSPPSPTLPEEPPPEDPPLEAPEDPPEEAPSWPESCPVVASPVVASIIEPEELPEEEDVPDEAPLDELPPDDAPPPDAPAPDEPTSLVASPGPALPSVDELPPQPAATSRAASNAIVANVGKRKSIFIDALLGRGALRETAVDGTFPSAEVRCNW
jgi:hypothetical protein